jgi:hypothetical protein
VIAAAPTGVAGTGRSGRHLLLLNGERPRDPNAPQLEGTGEIKLESVDRAGGYWTTRSAGGEVEVVGELNPTSGDWADR